MANKDSRKETLERIRESIVRNGQYIYVVSGGTTPRFAYTIGLVESIGKELILAGAVIYMADDVVRIMSDLASQLRAHSDRQLLEVSGEGAFSLRNVHHSWATKLILGACDYYQRNDVPAVQVVPDRAHATIDVPDLSLPWNGATEPVWRWLNEPWTYPVPKNSMATTNLAALRGERITEVMRWEEDQWEAFAGAGPDVPRNHLRVVPLGTLLAADEALSAIVNLPVGAGLWRDGFSQWQPWRAVHP